MNTHHRHKMTVDEYLDWYQEQPEGKRFELVDGQPVAMSPQRVRHIKVKHYAANALERAIRKDNLQCDMLADGITVRIDEHTSFEPDALVYCGDELDGDDIEAPEPVIIIEVLSPGTKNTDTGKKLAGYLSLKSVSHYLVIDPVAKIIMHHQKTAPDKLMTTLIREGQFELSPPGLQVSHADFFIFS